MIQKNELVLSRDIFGEKPLYIYRDKDSLIFGSEIKYLLNISQKNALTKLTQIKSIFI